LKRISKNHWQSAKPKKPRKQQMRVLWKSKRETNEINIEIKNISNEETSHKQKITTKNKLLIVELVDEVSDIVKTSNLNLRPRRKIILLKVQVIFPLNHLHLYLPHHNHCNNNHNIKLLQIVEYFILFM
jgi:hypothetical protein